MLAEVVLKKVKKKNKDGSYSYVEKPVSTHHKSTWKPTKIKIPKWVKEWDKKAAPKKKSILRVSPTQWIKMELEKKGRDLNKECKSRREELQAEYENYYKKYPNLRPQERPKPSKIVDGEDVPCSNAAFSSCKSTVYKYPSGKQKIVITEKLPVVKKEKKPVQQTKRKNPKFKQLKNTQYKGVSDGCSCRFY